MPVAVDHCRRDLVQTIHRALELADKAPGLRWEDNRGGLERVGVRRVEDIGELAMLRLQLAWETFIEDVFVRYLCGARTASGFRPTLRQARFRSTGAALATLRGGQRYLSWSPANTLNRASVHFDNGEPFTFGFRAVRATVDEMAAVRNRIAHTSDYANDEFRAVVRGRFGFVARGMTPGRFLLTTIPGSGQPGQRIIEDFGFKLLAASTSIVP